MKLENMAIRLYESTCFIPVDIKRVIWVNFFKKSELIYLWDKCIKDLNLPYDDEVFEALH